MYNTDKSDKIESCKNHDNICTYEPLILTKYIKIFIHCKCIYNTDEHDINETFRNIWKSTNKHLYKRALDLAYQVNI